MKDNQQQLVPSKDQQSLYVPEYEELLSRAKTQWQFGDWQSLAGMEYELVQHHENRAALALLIASAIFQVGDIKEAKSWLNSAISWGADSSQALNVLTAGVYNSLGGAALASGCESSAEGYYQKAIKMITPENEAKLFAAARISLQDKLSYEKHEANRTAKFVLPDWLEKNLAEAPEDPVLLISAGESALRAGAHLEAIQFWQRLASVDGKEMKVLHYERLAEAYRQIKSFPQGTPEQENTSRGDIDKHELLEKIHSYLEPANYLEIGVQTGKSLRIAKCPAIGVDPMPMLGEDLPDTAVLIKDTSDNFFKEKAIELINSPIGMAFIDGMHLFEYVLRDFINVEKYSDERTLVVIDDVLPGHPVQADRIRKTRAWTGDVWKMVLILKKYRPDLKMRLLDVRPTGLLCISNLDKYNTMLSEKYSEIEREFKIDMEVPGFIMDRVGAESASDMANLKTFFENYRI